MQKVADELLEQVSSIIAFSRCRRTSRKDKHLMISNSDLHEFARLIAAP
jgi:hypothetical protein